MSHSTACPSCKLSMDVCTLSGVTGGTVDLDLCYSCHAIWFDPMENLKLTPAAVVELFGLLHGRRDAERRPLARHLGCPRCGGALTQGFDVVKSGRYVTYRCPQRHGRLSAFSSFMVEKGFVRQLTPAEIDDMAQRVAVIYCTGCGAPVDIRKDHACPHCRSAFSLLDPKAVEQALQGYARAAHRVEGVRLPELADALVMVERDRLRAERDAKAQRGAFFSTQETASGDLWAAGLAMVWAMLK